jgi:3-deoxy-manno-octulosonate cytidylyltransferase (CMP-KDO synthetase)
MESTRLPGKIMADILGAPMIMHVIQQVGRAKLVDKVVVATDSYQVQSTVTENGGIAIMTRSDHKCGTDRIAEVAESQAEFDVVLNVQGDQPLIHPEAIDSLIRGYLEGGQTAAMATLVSKIKEPRQIQDPNVVKVIFDRSGSAIYFSRSPIPYRMEQRGPSYYKHIGVYLYDREFLLKFRDLPPSALEASERLEQLRAIENGYKIRVVKTTYDCPSVEDRADLERVRNLMRGRPNG